MSIAFFVFRHTTIATRQAWSKNPKLRAVRLERLF
jgi:hypothetical protein